MRKQELRDLIESLPEDVDPDDVLYRVYLKAKLDAAEDDVAQGRLVPHDQVVERSDEWLK